MAVSRFVNVTEKMVNTVEEIQFWKAQKMLLSLVQPFSKVGYKIFAVKRKQATYLDANNENNCNRKYAKFSLFTEWCQHQNESTTQLDST